MRPAKEVRLFFALWPDARVRLAISDSLKRFDLDRDKSRLISDSNLHLTLHFIGNQSLDEMACLDRQASKVIASPFDLTINYSGYFKKPKVLWFSGQHTPQALYDLHRVLGQKISQCEFEPEQRPYSSHITVARKIDAEPPTVLFEPIHWRVDRFVLIESISIPGGVHYQVAKSYPLSGSQGLGTI